MHVLIPIDWSRIMDKKKSNLDLSIHPISKILCPTWWITRLYRVCKKQVCGFWVACGKIVCGIGGSYRIKDDSTIELWFYLVDLFPWRLVVNLSRVFSMLNFSFHIHFAYFFYFLHTFVYQYWFVLIKAKINLIRSQIVV